VDFLKISLDLEKIHPTPNLKIDPDLEKNHPTPKWPPLMGYP